MNTSKGIIDLTQVITQNVHMELFYDISSPQMSTSPNLSLAVNDPFGWNITKSTALYDDFTVNTCNDIHAHAVVLRAAWSFGGNKVNNVHRDSKERESSRSY